MPFPRAKPIPDTWSADHQPIAELTLTGEIEVRGTGLPSGWDPETGPTPGEPGPVLYSGPFRAQQRTEVSAPLDAAGQPVTVLDYLLVLPARAPAAPPGTRCTVLSCPDDEELVGKVFTVVGAVLGSRRFERDYYAEIDLNNQPEVVSP